MREREHITAHQKHKNEIEHLKHSLNDYKCKLELLKEKARTSSQIGE
jgi:hypothetical protein